MKKLTVLLTKEPYGFINAAEAVRHVLGAVGEELEVSLVLVDGGVLLAAKGQDEAGTGFTNLGHKLRECIDKSVSVLAEDDSLRRGKLDAGDIIEGVEIAGSSKVAELMKDADHTIIF